MLKKEQIEKLKPTPKTEILAGRFTKKEAAKIKEFCSENEISQSRLIRYGLKKIISNL